MTDAQTLDTAAGHRHFSAHCFNRAWEYIEKPSRTPEENEAMVMCAVASLWHWTQRPDHTNKHLSIGHWQVSRAYALAGQGQAAMHHAQRSLHFARTLLPFFQAYAQEALARAAKVLGDDAAFREHMAAAERFVLKVEDAQDKAALEKDLNDLIA